VNDRPRDPDGLLGHSGELTVPMALVIYAYGALMLALPFLADAGAPSVVLLVAWLGASWAAGALIPRRWMFAVPFVVLVVLVVVLMGGYTDSEFLSDPLSIIALFTLAAGELFALACGYGTAAGMHSRKRRRP
jgi:hypothetical protein